jgi:integration host factor subunit alpha
MSLGKQDIIKNISSKAQVSSLYSKSILQGFISLIIKNAKTKNVKIANFGTFSTNITPKRVGRNPKTKEEFLISKKSKLIFKPSSKFKILLN